jgi:hypothetical protein
VLKKLSATPSRTDLLTFLSDSASYGNLGLLVGAGFSKAVLNDSPDDEIALSWGELLSRAATKIGVDYSRRSREYAQ